MNINVPLAARDHFWHEPPEGHHEFWSFRFPPPCKPGDPLAFRFDGVIVATAVVDRIERPGVSKCEGSGRFGGGWKVFWRPETFVARSPLGRVVSPAGDGAAAATERGRDHA